jgi:SAM-dependent MidA family methyltransferase
MPKAEWSTLASVPSGIRRSAFSIDVSLIEVIREQIRSRGPLTAADFIETALYHPELGYYARADRRSGRGGDFFTSVDVGPLFGELLAVQIAECFDWLDTDPQAPGLKGCRAEAALAVRSGREGGPQAPFDLVEAGAGDGRLARDVLDALERDRPDLHARTRVHLVDRSPEARRAQQATLGSHARRLEAAGPDGGLPRGTVGVVYANELIDALPVHLVVMRERGLREIFVGQRDDALVEVEGAPSSPALQEYLDRAGIALEPGGRAEINLAADRWIAAAAESIDRGFLLLIDYGHEAAELFSGSHATGTLTTFSSHRSGRRAGDWLVEPGERDITSHVDLTSVRMAAERAGFTTLGITDQTYFLLGLGLPERIQSGSVRINQAKTLMLPGGLGSTHKVMIFSKSAGRPRLKGLSYRVRVT